MPFFFFSFFSLLFLSLPLFYYSISPLGFFLLCLRLCCVVSKTSMDTERPASLQSSSLSSWILNHLQFYSHHHYHHGYNFYIDWEINTWWWWLLLYSAILRSRADSLRSHVILHEWLDYFIARFLISIEVVYLQRWHGWCHMNLLPSRRVLRTPYNHAPCHFMQSHIPKVYACLAVTCHLQFWQDDRDLLRATAVTRGWNGYRNRSQHRKLTLEKKILPPFQEIGRQTDWLIVCST